MAEKTITRLDLAAAVHRKCGIRKQDCAKLVANVLDCITRGLVEDGEVKLSSFATFTVASKRARVGRNPKTGEEKPVSARKTIKFRPSHHMKSRVEDVGK